MASLWNDTVTPATVTDNDANAVEVGVKFRANVDGLITGLRFYKGPQNTGTHVGNLWTASGTKLGSVTFTNETSSGWQQQSFANPIPITAGTTYVASYFAPNGRYSVNNNYFTTATTNGPLTALANGTEGGNGVYRYSATSAFPTSSFQASNYWVDVVFTPADASNTPPVAANDSASTNEDAPVIINVRTNDSDPDGDTLTVTTVNTTGTQGQATINPDNTITYDPGSAFQSLNQGQSAQDSFSYTISDGRGGTATATVSVTIAGRDEASNTAPVAVNDSANTNEDTPVTINVRANDSDPDGNPLTVTAVNTTGTQGQVTINPDNTVTYNPGAAFQSLNQGETAQDSFGYTISDGQGGTATATVAVTVAGRDDGSAGPVSLWSNSTTPATVTDSDSNAVELGVKFRANVDGLITGLRFYKGPQNTGTHVGNLWTASGTKLGSVTFTNETSSGWQQQSFANPIPITAGTTYVASYLAPNGHYSVNPNYFATATTNGSLTALASGTEGGNGVYRYSATSAFPTSSFQASNYWVDVVFTAGAAGNSPPVAANDSASTDEDTPVTINVRANDSDPNGDTLTVTAVNTTGTQGQVTINPDNTVTYNPGAAFQALNQGQSAQDSFGYTISDGKGGTATATVAVTIAGRDDAGNNPPLAVNDSAATNEDTPVTINVRANDSDPDGDPLTVTAVSNAVNGTVAIDAQSGNPVFTPAANYNGSASFRYTISDGKGGTATATANLSVAAVNDPPVASGDSYSASPNTPLTVSAANGVLANDRDPNDQPPNNLSAALVGGPAHGTATLAADGSFTYTPATGFSGADSFTYRVSDDGGTANGGSNIGNVATASLNVGSTTTNPIVAENAKPGNPRSEWDISGGGSSNIQGFATDMSVDQGQTVNFKIQTNSTNYRIDIYRLGYYGGMGARKVATIQRTLAQAQQQPNPLTDPTTGLVDAGNWAVSASWAVPSDAVSGVYIAKLVRQDGVSGSNHIPFIVRDDGGTSDLIMQTSDTTWQAYNTWGGNSLYTGSPDGRAYKVSYNRPFTNRGDSTGTTGPRDFLFDSDYPMLRWLEANGYSVSYISGVDTDRRGSELLNHKAFVAVGHDEYWSGQQRANVEAARDAGVNLAFFNGNEVFWKTRWENGLGASGAPYRTLVSYKETHADAKIDPSPEWTGTWRDPRFSPPSDGGRPENGLTGTIFTVNGGSVDRITVPAADGKMRFWRNTDIANLAPGQTATLNGNALTYEWDEDLDNGFRPAGLIRLSSTTDNSVQYLQDYGSNYGPGTATHSMTMYRDDSGALVFGAGTPRWSWGLDGTHDLDQAGSQATVTDARARQATVNLFADMGVQPATLQSGLVRATASTDKTAPTSTVTAPTNGSSIEVGRAVTITGTATDTGGVVGGVEVSVDGGTTWHRAQGRSAWTYNWVPDVEGTATLRSRAADDSLNLETPGPGVQVAVGGSGPVSGATIWSNSTVPAVVTESDASAVELGVKFRSSSNGHITGLRFYKGPQNTGTHVGSLWTASGTKLGSLTFTNETSSGWQQQSFANPIPITAGTTYVASYHAPNGQYSVTENYFATATTNGPLTALADGTQGGNGVYAYGASAFPTNSFNRTNYWVDVVFSNQVAA